MKTSIIQTSMKAFKWRKWCNTKSYERIIRTDDNKSVTADEVNSYRHGFESNPWTVPNHLSFKGCKSKRSYLDVTLWIPSLTESDFTLTKYIVAPSWLGLKSFSVKYYMRSGCNVCFKYLECSLRIDRTPRKFSWLVIIWYKMLIAEFCFDVFEVSWGQSLRKWRILVVISLITCQCCCRDICHQYDISNIVEATV